MLADTQSFGVPRMCSCGILQVHDLHMLLVRFCSHMLPRVDPGPPWRFFFRISFGSLRKGRLYPATRAHRHADFFQVTIAQEREIPERDLLAAEQRLELVQLQPGQERRQSACRRCHSQPRHRDRCR